MKAAMRIAEVLTFHCCTSNSSTRIQIPVISAQNFSLISDATNASSFQNPQCVMQSFSSFNRFSVSGLVVLYSPLLCFPRGKHHFTISRTPQVYGTSGLCCARYAMNFAFVAFISAESYIYGFPVFRFTARSFSCAVTVGGIIGIKNCITFSLLPTFQVRGCQCRVLTAMRQALMPLAVTPIDIAILHRKYFYIFI